MDNQVKPGAYTQDCCPKPTRVECIVVDKVYDSCFQVEDRTRTTTVTTGVGGQWPTNGFSVGQIVPCSPTADAGITCTELSRVPVGEGFSTITILVSVPITLANPNAPEETTDRVFTFTKTATLCCPEGVEPDCSESTLMFCNCVITQVNAGSVEITCDYQVCLLMRCILTVQLLVPSYGFCVPAPCTTIGGTCPPLPPSQCGFC